MAPVQEDFDDLNGRFPCRSLQIKALGGLFAENFPTPPALVVHGLEATGKSSITRSILEALDVPHAVINSRECITGRHLLEQTALACREVIGKLSGPAAKSTLQTRCDSLNGLVNQLEKILQGQPKFILVFDGIDRQKEAPSTLIPALARFGSIIPNLSVVFIISVPSPRLVHSSGIPHIHFPPYSKDETLEILAKTPQQIFLGPVDPSYDYGDEEAAEDSILLWGRYCAVVWDSLAKGAARDLESFRVVCHKLWRPFVQPVVDGTFGTRDFSRLIVSRRAIFQSEDVLTDEAMAVSAASTGRSLTKVAHELPYYSKFVLCAAYLASYNPARQDSIYFMKNSERKRRKRTGGQGGRASKHRKIPRNLLAPSPFSLDRLLAIIHALLPLPLPQSSHVFSQIATLSSLRLILRTGGSGVDLLDPSSRFRVNCSWEYVASLGRSVGLEMRDYLAT